MGTNEPPHPLSWQIVVTSLVFELENLKMNIRDIAKNIFQLHGARAALCRCKNRDSKYGEWLTHKKESLTLNKAAEALANKNARIIWSLLKTGEEFNSNQQKVAA